MQRTFKQALAIAAVALTAQAQAQVTLYENKDFGGRTFSTGAPVENLQRFGFNDKASSVVVVGERWELCQDAGFAGHCVVLRPGRYASLASMGLNDQVSSLRSARDEVRGDFEGNAPSAAVDYRRRDQERLYEARVTSVHAVLGPAQQRCWVESESAPPAHRTPDMLAGALIGGILGHQLGGRGIATVGGAAVGAAIGDRVARNSDGPPVDVQRCASTQADSDPRYWDATYEFRGQEHRVQLTAPPGEWITVNDQGEPRV